MRVTLDGQNLFDEQQLEIEPGSISRVSIERAVAGLDGVLSIDMGGPRQKDKTERSAAGKKPNANGQQD